MNHVILIAGKAYNKMLTHIQHSYPNEAGGILCGPPGSRIVCEFIPSDSKDFGPFSFVTNAEKDQPVLNRLYAAYGFDQQGTVHSHPHGPENPSRRDLNTSASIYRRMKKHNGTTPIMGLMIFDSTKECRLKMYQVAMINRRALWIQVNYEIVPDFDVRVRSVSRIKFPSNERAERIEEELVKMRLTYGPEVRISHSESFDCTDVDVPFKLGIVRIRIGSGFPQHPPRLWYLDTCGAEHNLNHEFLFRWSDTFFLWEILDNENGFFNQPWTTVKHLAEVR